MIGFLNDLSKYPTCDARDDIETKERQREEGERKERKEREGKRRKEKEKERKEKKKYCTKLETKVNRRQAHM